MPKRSTVSFPPSSRNSPRGFETSTDRPAPYRIETTWPFAEGMMICLQLPGPSVNIQGWER